MGSHLANGQEQLVGDLLVGGRAWRPRSEPCTGGTAPPGRGAGCSRGSTGAAPRVASATAIAPRLGERNMTVVVPNRSVSPSFSRRRPLRRSLVDERAVARQAIVDQRPTVRDPLESGVKSRDLIVPVDAQDPTTAGGRPRRTSSRMSNEKSCCLPSRSRTRGTAGPSARPRRAPASRTCLGVGGIVRGHAAHYLRGARPRRANLVGSRCTGVRLRS